MRNYLIWLFALAALACAPAPTLGPATASSAAPGMMAPATAPRATELPEATATATATATASTDGGALARLAPPGFPSADEFEDAATACAALVPRMVAREDLRPPILAWCEARAWASSRNGKVRSRLDGSWIHDRDRPSGYAFYRQGLKAGHLDPDACPAHVVDESLSRSRAAREFPDHWPYTTHCDHSQGACSPAHRGHMLPSTAKAWHKHAPDYERFGTRGPVDNNLWVATKYLGGCFPPEALDRYDVSVAVTIERSEDLCQRLEKWIDTRADRTKARAAGIPVRCVSRHDLRDIWHPRFWYSEFPRAMSPRG